jgi:RNA polymerase sigma-70 factor (ECF subfamily)
MTATLCESSGERFANLLLERAQQGDKRALDAIVRRELPKVRKLLGRWLGTRSDLEDLVQTVFVELCGALGKYRGGDESSVSGFVRGYAKMVALRAMHPPAWDRRRCALDFEPANGEIDPQEKAVRREQVRRVSSALTRISARKRYAFMLWAIDGKTPEEISRLTNASIPAVRSRIFYAQKELKKMANKDPYLSELVC